jgi:hypothetical protein
VRVKNLIIGAGPTGLLLSSKMEDAVIITENVGGLVNSCEKNGFIFDRGLHIYTPFSEPLVELMKASQALFIPERKAYFLPDKVSGKYVTFPVQNHTDELGIDVKPTGAVLTGEENFDEYIVATYGEEFCAGFLRPFNQRVWSSDTKSLGSYWTSERVTKPGTQGQPGMHDSFYYVPGANIIKTLLSRTCAKILVGTVYSIDKENKTVLIQNGDYTDEIRFERCFCTAPILTRQRHNHVLFVGVGLNTKLPIDESRMFHWVYCNLNSTVHRVSTFSQLYPLSPRGCDILSLEIPYRYESYPTSKERFVDSVIKGLMASEYSAKRIAHELLQNAGFDCITHDMIDTVWHANNIGYATQTIYSRMEVMRLKKEILKHGIFLCGRWGAHAYMNFQHVFRDVEAVYRASTLDDKEDYFTMPYCFMNKNGLGRSYVNEAIAGTDEGRRILYAVQKKDRRES